MTLGFDDVAATLLVDTTETLLNAGTALTTPNNAQQILEVAPYINTQGAVPTTDETQMPFMRIQSDDVAIEPKLFSMPVSNGTDGTPVNALGWSPIYPAYPMNIPIAEQSRINYFGDLDEAMTIDGRMAATVVYSDQPTNMPQMFYQRGASASTSGTADNARTAGVDITITGGAEIVQLINTVGITLSAPSIHATGFMEYASSDFQTSFPYRVAFTQVVESVSASGSTDGGAGIKIWKMPIGQGIPIAGRTVINTFITQRDAVGTGFLFNHCVGYIK